VTLGRKRALNFVEFDLFERALNFVEFDLFERQLSGCDFNRSLQHLDSITGAGGVADGLSNQDLLQRV
jgi:hypothetical protein